MANDNKKNIVLKVDEDFHQQIKLHVTINKTTIQSYIVELIKKDLDQSKKGAINGEAEI